ncbi:MAG: hypothetical protein K8L99_33480 [Anaerolineae bacterium]|nr:hypothetical protein [Anaerolineae bacterium]
MSNPLLELFNVLVGEWNVVGMHRLLPDTLHGRASFEWLEIGAFLMMVWEIEAPEIPDAIAIFGSDDAAEMYSMLYFDERAVSRRYEMTLSDNVWKYWRDAPGFSQRFTGMLADDSDTIIGIWELSEDDSTWRRDLELTYSRVK